MNIHHAWAITLRHARLFRRDLNCAIALFAWPLIDVLLWGFLGTWVQQEQSGSSQVALVFLMGMVLSQVVIRTTIRVSCSLLEEIWSKNLTNVCATPLRNSEWILGIVFFIIGLNCIGIVYSLGLMSFLYTFSLQQVGKVLLFLVPPLCIAGLALGFATMSCIIYFGRRVEEVGFVLAFLFGPFSGVYYPIDSLPVWAQKISVLLPMSYAFEGMRAMLVHEQSIWPYVLKSYALSCIYTSIAFGCFVGMFALSKRRGLSRLAD